MQNEFYTKESKDIDFFDLINQGLVLVFSSKFNIIILILLLSFIGFIQTSNIQPEFESNSRLLIEVKKNKLLEEQTVSFTSSESSDIGTQIEVINSNTLLHNVVKKNNIKIPVINLTNENSSRISRLSYQFQNYTGISFFLNLLGESATAVKETAIIKSVDVALDTVVNSVDNEKIDQVSNKILNEFNLDDEQLKKLDFIKTRMQECNNVSCPNESGVDSEEVIGFAYEVLSSNNYSDSDILDLAKEYIPESLKMDDITLLNIIQKYKSDENSFTEFVQLNEINIEESNDINSSNKIIPNENNNLSLDTYQKEQQSNLEINQKNGNEEEVQDYFEKVNNNEFDIGLISWLRSNLRVWKDPNANIINISFKSSDPFVSKNIADGVALEYLEYQRISKESAGLYSVEYYQKRIDELRFIQDKLSEEILIFETDNNIYADKIDRLENNIREYENELRSLKNEELELLKIYKIGHPELLDIKDRIVYVEDFINDLSVKISNSRSISSQLKQLDSKYNVNEALLTSYLNKLLTISSYNQSDARILESAKKGKLLNKSEASRVIIKFIIFGIAASIAYMISIIFIDFYSLKNKFQMASQIKESLDTDTSGVIPHINGIKKSNLVKVGLGKNKVLQDSITKTLIKFDFFIPFFLTSFSNKFLIFKDFRFLSEII